MPISSVEGKPLRQTAADERQDVQDRLLRFIKQQLPGSSQISVQINRLAGEGDSQQNWLFDVLSSGEKQGYVLRRNGPSAASESDRGREFRVLKALQNAGVHAPKVFWLDETGEHFGRPAFIMEQCAGTTDMMALTPANRFGWDEAARVGLARRLTELMARIHSLDWQALGLNEVLPVPQRPAAESRLSAITADIEKHKLHPWPELDEVIDWLRAHMPAPRPLVFTHGEFRVVQTLLDANGNIKALLDWEFARVSDPIEELAYYTIPVMAPMHLIPGAWEEKDYIAHYELTSGLQVVPEEFHWWRVLNMLWVMSFLLQSIRGLREGRVDAIRTHPFNLRLTGMLLSLINV